MKASWYAEALYSSLKGVNTEQDVKKIFARFHKVMIARGHEKLFHFATRDIEKIITREKIKSEVILVTANTKSKGKWDHACDHYEKEGIVPKGSVRRNIVDESIVGGFQIRTKDMLIDGSYKKSLALLYRKITNS